jgi:hypothetical protein
MRNKNEIVDSKVTNFKMYKVNKKWVFASALMLSMLGAGMAGSYEVKADVVSPDTTTISITQQAEQKATTDQALTTTATSQAVSEAAPASEAPASTASTTTNASEAPVKTDVQDNAASSTTAKNESATNDAKDAKVDQDTKANATDDANKANDAKSDVKDDTKSDDQKDAAKDSAAPASDASTDQASSAANTSETSSAASSNASSSASSAATDQKSSAATSDAKDDGLDDIADSIDTATSSTSKKDDLPTSQTKGDAGRKTSDQSKKTDTNKKNKSDDSELQALLRKLAQEHPNLRAGIEVLADGELKISGTAADGLDLNSDGSYSGILQLIFDGYSFGFQVDEKSEYIIRVPKELQALFASKDFNQYISGEFKYYTVGSEGGWGYLPSDINIASDGSVVTFNNFRSDEVFGKHIIITINIDLGKAVTDTGIRIDDSNNNYEFGGALIEGGELVDWNIIGDYTDNAQCSTNNMMPDSDTEIEKPYVNQPVTDSDTVITGKGLPHATITIKNDDGSVVLGTAVADASGNFTVRIPAQTAGDHINVTQTLDDKTSEATVVEIQETPAVIERPTIDPAYDGESQVTGRGELPGDVIFILDSDGNILGQGTVGPDGNYSITTERRLKEGEVIRAFADRDGAKSAKTSATVLHQNQIPAPDVNTVHESDHVITGSGYKPGDTITVKDSKTGKTIGLGLVDDEGNFSIAINGDLTAGQVLSITESNDTEKPGTKNIVVVRDAVAPAAPVVTQDVYDDSTVVVGTAKPGSTITVSANGEVIGTGVTDANGNFTVTIPKQPSSTDLTVTATLDGATSEETHVTVKIPQPATNQVYDIDKTVTGTGSQAGNTINIYDSNNNLIGTGKINADLSYNIALNRAVKAGEVIYVYETDGNETSIAHRLVVLHQEDLAAPTVNPAFGGDTTLTGKGTVPGDVISVYDDYGNLIGTGRVNPDKTFTIDLDRPLVAGEVVSVDENNGGTTSPSTMVPVNERSHVDAPTINEVKAGATTVTGKGTAGDTVTITDSKGNVLGTSVVGSDGTYTVNLNRKAVANETLTAVQTDAVGNASDPVNVQVDNVDVPAPTVNVIIEGDTQISGQGVPGDVVIAKDDDGNEIGRATVDSDGNFTIDLDRGANEGERIHFTQVDPDGNSSESFFVIVQGFVAVPEVNPVNEGATSVTGKGVPGDTVAIRDSDGNVLGRATVNSDGTYTINLSRETVAGEVLTAVQIDAKGNRSKYVNVTVGNADVVAPTINNVREGQTVITGQGTAGNTVVITDSKGNELGRGVVSADGTYSITISREAIAYEILDAYQVDANGNESDRTQTTVREDHVAKPDINGVKAGEEKVTGTGVPGSTIIITDSNGIELGRGTVGTDGTYSVDLNRKAVANETLHATQVDDLGHASDPAETKVQEVNVDKPTIDEVRSGSTTVTGTGVAGDTVIITDADGKELGRGVVGEDNTYSITLNRKAKGDEKLYATQVDTLGNQSEKVETTVVAVHIDPPTVNDVTEGDSKITGKGEPGDTITIKDGDGNVIGTGVVDGDGNYSIDVDGSKITAGEDLTVIQTDADGNESDPATATVKEITPLSNVKANFGTGMITGNGMPGATINIMNDKGEIIGTFTVEDNGTFVIDMLDLSDEVKKGSIIMVQQVYNGQTSQVAVQVGG